MDIMDAGGFSDEDTQASIGPVGPRRVLKDLDTETGDLFLPVFSSSMVDCCTPEEILGEDSAWSGGARVSALSWDWDEPSFSPSRLRADSGCSSSSCSPPGYCRSSSLSFVPGESARPEYSSPRSPRLLSGRPLLGDELEGLLESQLVVPQRRTRRTYFPPSQTEKSAIVPYDLAEGEFDYQGIPWSRFSISRTEYRAKRVREYSNYNNVNWNAKLEMQRRRDVSGGVVGGGSFFNFYETYKSINPTIDHFQLRHLLWSTSNVTSYYVSNSVLYSFNKQSKIYKRMHAANPQQMACCCVDHGLAVSGSFDSEVRVTRIEGDDGVGGSPHSSLKISALENSITNHVAIPSSDRLVVANNDQHVSEVDLAAECIVTKHKWSWAVNHVSVSPLSSSVLCLSGDNCQAALLDRRSGQAVCAPLTGHLDFLFCSSWQSETVLCTGSQDGTCRLWDLRKPSQSTLCLGSLLGAVRSAKFSNNGKWLAFSEPADFVHVYDTHNGYRECQILDFFGNISGIAFSPDSSKLSISVADTMFGSLVDFQVASLPFNTLKH